MGNGSFKSSALVPGVKEAFFVGPPTKDKLLKNSPEGSVLLGAISYGKLSFGAQGEGKNPQKNPVSHQISYQVPPNKFDEDKGKGCSTACTKSVSESLEEEQSVIESGWPLQHIRLIQLIPDRDRTTSLSNSIRPISKAIDQTRLRFLFQKELQTSDVGSLRRMIVPKKVAEDYLPILKEKEAFVISMDDMDGLHAWSFKFRIRFKSFTSLLQNKGQRLSKMMQLFMHLVQNGVVGLEGLDLEHCHRKLMHKHTKVINHLWIVFEDFDE